MNVFGRSADNVLRGLSHADTSAQTTVHKKTWCAVGVSVYKHRGHIEEVWKCRSWLQWKRQRRDFRSPQFLEGASNGLKVPGDPSGRNLASETET